ncbi:zinc finger, CCHC-type containing protein [Tanacetum coccineum]
MAENTVKDMTTNFRKLDKFEGHDFRRWQKKMYFLLTTLKVVYVLTTPMPELVEDATVKAIRIRAKWENDDYLCRGHILNGMSDSLFDIYTNVESAKELILGQYTQHDLKMNESISISSIIDKLPPSWKDFKHNLKHGKDDLSLVQLGSHLCIEESLRAHDSDKGKGKEVGGPSVNMKEEVPTRNQSWNVRNVARHVTLRGIAEVVKRTTQMLVVRERGLRTIPKTKVDVIAWWIDSGATTHVCKDHCWFKTFEPVDDGSVLYMGNDHFAFVHGKGSVVLEFSSGKTITLFNVLYVPKLRKNFISGPVLNKCGYKQVYESDKYILSKCGVFVGFGYYNNGMFMLNLNKVPDNSDSVYMSSSSTVVNSSLWHARLGHVHYKRMLEMSKDDLIPAINENPEKCTTCMLTKITRKPFQSIKRKSVILELIHSNLCDFHATPYVGNKKYVITFIDDSSRFCYVYLLHAKDEAFDRFRIYKTKVELQQNNLIKTLRTDRGGEYYDPIFLQSVGIIHEITAPYTPQQNGAAERKNKALKEMVPFWGCRAVVRLPDPKRKTLGEKGIDCIFVGYAEHSKAYRFYVIEPNDSVSINSIIESRDAIFDENRFSLIPRPKDIIPNVQESQMDDHTDDVPSCKWIFTRKMKVDRTIEKFKARMVIQGFRQKEGIDYFDTYATVARITTIRLLLALAAIHNLVIHQMDVKTSFLNGDLDEEVYMKQPEGFVMPGSEHKVCKLVKSLYGLKQAPKQWHQKFDEVVLSSGFHLNQSEKCVYSKFDNSGKGVIICLYVDDMLIFGTDQNQVDKTKKFLSSKFSMKDMGEADVILGIKIKRENTGIVITQSHYIEKILKKFNRKDCSLVSTPKDPVEKLKPSTGKPVGQLEYSREIGCLMYAMTSTRPDIVYVVGRLSRFTSNPTRQHWKEITRVFKYLRCTKDYGLSYVGYPSVLEGYLDASWINHVEDLSSTSGWVFLLRGGAISWASKKQTCIIGLTMESKFVALAAPGKKAEWLRNLKYEIPIWPKPIAPISIRCDSEPTMARAYSQIYNGKSRHLGVRHSMVRELIRNGVITIEFVRTQRNLTDHLTKGLARDLVNKPESDGSFPLLEYFPIASEEYSTVSESFPLLMFPLLKGFSTVEVFPLLSKDKNYSELNTKFGDSYKAPPEETGKGVTGEGSAKKKGRIVAITNEDMQKRRNDVKARTTLLLALPDEHQLRFIKYDNAKELWEAILKTFGGNEATKKTKKNQLKQQYGNFKAEGSETLEQTFNRLQAIVSHLEFMDVPIEQDDLNQKFLTSLASEWLVYTIVWRNKDDLDTMSLDNVYNHLKVYEPEVQKRAVSNLQNMAFISSSNTTSGKSKVPTVQGFSTASVQTASGRVSTANTDIAAASLSYDTVCAFIATQPNGSQIKYEDITQIDDDEIEEIT